MSELETLESADPSNIPASASKQKLTWRWQWLIAPLMGISIVLHIALLFVPLPSREVAEEETAEDEIEEVDDEEPIDILSLSDIEIPEPPAEPPPEQPQPQQQAPPPDAVPPPPDPTQVEELPPEEQFIEEDFPEENGFPEEEAPVGFDLARQQTLLGQTGAINREFDQTDYFPLYAWNPTGDNSPTYLGGWAPETLSCFFSSIEESSFVLDPRADRLKYLVRNYGLVVSEDLPQTFAGQTVVPTAEYCGMPLYEVQEGGATTGIYVSTIGIGPGSPPGAILLIFWTSDPRV
ncbi:hypothetical protein PN498_09375 [Oscillatoria sp. CS-180]|uniref:hypothetical protein n=1 Tax=Oscillatoria sp. CS-180 TaxID=3021720 RepID=UPI00232B112A|nr:hypothetical protein [Oscillatoria sp. CS-180]MDB9526195.1 hypothetical protein [Oscillatoria sp. CS-180]